MMSKNKQQVRDMIEEMIWLNFESNVLENIDLFPTIDNFVKTRLDNIVKDVEKSVGEMVQSIKLYLDIDQEKNFALIRVDDKWYPKNVKDVKKGDRFQVYKSRKKTMDDKGNSEWIAASDSYIKDNGEWGINVYSA